MATVGETIYKQKIDDLHRRIEILGTLRAEFALKSLMASGHVSLHVMEKTLDLAETVKSD
jgi:hypothetical protein